MGRLPNVVLESLASGTPVIVSDAANNDNLVYHSKNGRVVPTGDMDQLADVLYDVVNLPIDELEAKSTICQKSVESYSIPTMVQTHQQLYHSLLS